MPTPNEEYLRDGLEGTVVGAGERRDVGVLVLAGSSGRVDVERARLLARAGALAVALRWFGGAAQPPGICEVPLETFVAAVDWLVEQGAGRIGIVGQSKGAEAALLAACRDARVTSVVGISPSSVTWANVGPGVDGRVHPYRSSWTWRGEPLPFVPYDESWDPGVEPVAFRSLYETSLLAFPAARAAAAIPVERCEAELLLVAGGDDAMWPSDAFAAELAARRGKGGSAGTSRRRPRSRTPTGVSGRAGAGAVNVDCARWKRRRRRAARAGGLAARSRTPRSSGPGSRTLALRRAGADHDVDACERREPPPRGRTLRDHSAARDDHRSHPDDAAESAAARQNEDPRRKQPHADDLRDDTRLGRDVRSG